MKYPSDIQSFESIVGSISTFVLIYFCVKMHKFARAKIMAQIKKDHYDDIFESTKI